MPRIRRPTTATCAALLAVVALLTGVMFALRFSSARAVSIGELQRRISVGHSRVSSLAGAVGVYSSHLAQLDSSIASLQSPISRIQADLNVKEAELIKLEVALTLARNRLAQLEAFEAHGKAVLAKQLVNSYESAQPDPVSLVLESNGFQDLLERLSFAQRIQRQDVQIIKTVRIAGRRMAAEAVRLGALEVRQQALTTQVLNERNALATARTALLAQRIAVGLARGIKAGQLAAARSRLAGLQQQLHQAEAAQAAAAARAAAAAAAAQGQGGGSSAPPPASAPVSGSGGFVFPLPKASSASRLARTSRSASPTPAARPSAPRRPARCSRCCNLPNDPNAAR